MDGLLFDLGKWLFNAIGGTVRFAYGTLIRALRLTKRQSFSYEEYLNGPKVPRDKLFDGDAHRFNNILIGLLFLGALFGLTTC